MFQHAAFRIPITVNHGTTIAGTTRVNANVALAGAQLGDIVQVTPQAAPAAGILVLPSPRVGTAGSITIFIANVGTASVAPGTAAAYDVVLFRGSTHP